MALILTIYPLFLVHAGGSNPNLTYNEYKIVKMRCVTGGGGGDVVVLTSSKMYMDMS